MNCFLFNQKRQIIRRRAVAHAISRRFFAAEPLVPSQSSLCDICDRQLVAGTGFSTSIVAVPLSVSFHQCSVVIHLSNNSIIQ